MVISKWIGQAEKILAEGFSDKRQQKEKDEHELVQELYRQIGRLKVEVDLLKKRWALQSRKTKLLMRLPCTSTKQETYCQKQYKRSYWIFPEAACTTNQHR